jgi:LuxR family transcriptional regulator/LuxR family quorum-sensing system transcriptional regulator CciR
MNVDEFERIVPEAPSMDELWSSLVSFVLARGIHRVSYHHMPPVGAPDDAVSRVRSVGFPPEWLEHYFAGRAAGTTPIVNHARTHGAPVYWDDIETLRTLSQGERDHLAKLRAAGFVQGLAIPVYGPNGRNGVFGLGLAGEPARLDPGVLGDVHWACQTTHLRYCALLRADLRVGPALSKRETEVLSWVARGKSNAVIGGILGISAHTVDAHLRRIYTKLGVFDRISASLRGLGFGLITSDA